MTPLLWELLNFVAIYRPALCYCSVLLRALTAILIHQWRSMGDKNKSNATHQYNSLLDNTIKVVDIMALGQLLPPPLSTIREVFPHLKSFEVRNKNIQFAWNEVFYSCNWLIQNLKKNIDNQKINDFPLFLLVTHLSPININFNMVKLVDIIIFI